jgi:hypothetical protein
MKKSIPYGAMEEICKQHAELDKTTAELWAEEAEVWSKLKMVDDRLRALKAVGFRSRKKIQKRRDSVNNHAPT